MEPNVAWVLVSLDPFWRLERRRPYSMEGGIQVSSDLRSLDEYKVPRRLVETPSGGFTNYTYETWKNINTIYIQLTLVFIIP